MDASVNWCRDAEVGVSDGLQDTIFALLHRDQSQVHIARGVVPFAHVALIIMHGLAAFIACAAILAGAIGPMFGQVVRWALGIAANTT